MGNTHVARDYYGILGISTDAGPDEIKRAYRKLARELHPDVNPDSAAQERFAEVSAAYEVLSDPEKRRVVDLGGDPLGNGRGCRWRGRPVQRVRLRRHHGRLLRRSGGRRSRARTAQPHAAGCRCADPDAADVGGLRHRHQPRAGRGHRGAVLGVHRIGLRTRHRPHHVRHLQRPRRGAERAAFVPRPGGHLAAVSHLPWVRRDHPGSVPAVRRRRPGTSTAHRHGTDPGRGGRRDAGTPGRPG